MRFFLRVFMIFLSVSILSAEGFVDNIVNYFKSWFSRSTDTIKEEEDKNKILEHAVVAKETVKPLVDDLEKDKPIPEDVIEAASSENAKELENARVEETLDTIKKEAAIKKIETKELIEPADGSDPIALKTSSEELLKKADPS